MARRSLVIVANRLPVDQTVEPDGSVSWSRSPGGLVSALHPVLRDRRGTWIGWSGAIDQTPYVPDVDGIRMRAVPLSAAEYENYYEGYSNSTLWPLYHDAVEAPAFHRRWWEAYQRVNRRFAQLTADYAERDAIVWVQDYHLQLVPAMLRELRPDLRIGFFMHIPFPPAELFMQLPRRAELLRGMLGADLVGFQTSAGADNFLRIVSRILGTPVTPAVLPGPVAVSGNNWGGGEIEVDGRVVQARSFPISIDVGEMEELGRREDIIERAAKLRADLGEPTKVILGVDRLDYTKGIAHRIKAYRELLVDGRVKVQDTVMVQVAVPSRERVDHYRMLRDKVEREVGRINGEFGRLGVPAVHYLNQSFGRDELAALYLAADVMAVTPLRDGMNLVAKEYIATHTDNRGALVLSEFAGAAFELPEAYLVNPHDVDALKETMVRALEATPAENRARMRAMRRHVRAHDVRAWARSYLKALSSHSPARAA